jgi:hypothetical protein
MLQKLKQRGGFDMKQNIFLKSALRQPGRIVLLALLMAVAAFAFVARVVEYIVVSNEINRIEGVYNSIGILSPINPENITEDMDVTQAAEIVGASGFVAYEDRRVFVQGLLVDSMNAASHFAESAYFNPSMYTDLIAFDHYFIATITSQPRLVRSSHDFINVTMNIDEVIIGDPWLLPEGGPREVISARGDVVIVNSGRRDMNLHLTYHEATLMEQGLFDPFEGLEVGSQYLFRATPTLNIGFLGPRLGWELRSLIGEDGLRSVTSSFNPAWVFTALDPARRDGGLMFFGDAADGALLAQVQPQMELALESFTTMTVIGTKDMTTMPRFQNPLSGRLLDSPVVYGGRWLTYDDYVNQNPVAVVTGQMASRRNLNVGESFTITLRDNSRPNWIDQESDIRWASGIEGWWEAVPRGWWTLTEAEENRQDGQEHTITLEVVGIYWNTPLDQASHNFLGTEIYIPASLIPEGFGWENAPLLSTMYSFVLNSPRNEADFLLENTEVLRALGFMPNFIPNGFANFLAVADPIRNSITMNLVIFTLVSILVLTLVVFIYLRQWRRALAISRALGNPTTKALGQLFSPAFLVWIPAIILGATAAWFFALNQAQTSLAGLGDFAEAYEYTQIHLSGIWLFIVVAGIALVGFGGLIISGFSVASKPVLEQLQGGARKKMRRKKIKVVESGAINEGFVMGEINIPHKPSTYSKSAKTAASFRHIFRHIFRSPLKSALIATVALFFVVSLGWLDYTINFTESEIDRLWDTTIVRGEVVRNTEASLSPTVHWAGLLVDAPISQAVVDSFMASGFVDNMYLEAFWQFSFLRSTPYVPSAHPEENIPLWVETDLMLGVSDFYGFVDHNTRNIMDDVFGTVGEDIIVNFAPGFGSDNFIFGGGAAVVPVLVRASFLEEYGYNLGDYLILTEPFDAIAQVIGYFENGLSRAVNFFGELRSIVVMPIEAMRHHTLDSWHFETEDLDIGAQMAGLGLDGLTYKTFLMEMNSARNREVHQLRDNVATSLLLNSLGNPGNVPLLLFMDDQELRDVVEPMEQNLALLRVLYPIAIGVAFILSAGLSLLIMLQNAKNAAIMRILGSTKLKSQAKLFGEQVFVCAAGVILGIIALLIIGVSAFEVMPLALAGLYFVGTVMGSVAGAVIISGRTPLELLQLQARE